MLYTALFAARESMAVYVWKLDLSFGLPDATRLVVLSLALFKVLYLVKEKPLLQFNSRFCFLCGIGDVNVSFA
jgi:hypothetical protein